MWGWGDVFFCSEHRGLFPLHWGKPTGCRPRRSQPRASGRAGQELRRGEQLGLCRHKARPGGPAGLHGGCTESDLIRGTRPNELITGGGASCSPAEAAQGLVPPGGRGAWGANSGNPGLGLSWSPGPGSAPASLPGVLHACPSGAAQGAGSVLPSLSQAARWEAV